MSEEKFWLNLLALHTLSQVLTTFFRPKLTVCAIANSYTASEKFEDFYRASRKVPIEFRFKEYENSSKWLKKLFLKGRFRKANINCQLDRQYKILG